MQFILIIVISFLVLIGVYHKVPKIQTHLIEKAMAQPIATAEWVDATTDENKLKQFSDIQKTMGGSYLTETGTLSYLQRRLRINPERNWHFEIYEDADYQITLGFMYNKQRDRIKIAYAAIGRCKDYSKAADIAWKQAIKYYKSQGKNGYIIYSASGLEAKAVIWYGSIKKGALANGVKNYKEEKHDTTTVVEFDV